LLRLDRTRESFVKKISSKDPTTQRGYKIGLNNFDSFCMDKYGKIDCISDLKKGNEEDVFNFLQSWINWNSSLAPLENFIRDRASNF